MATRTKTFDEFLDEVAIDIGTQSPAGLVNLKAAESRGASGIDASAAWMYQGRKDVITYDEFVGTFEHKERDEIATTLTARIQEASEKLAQRGVAVTKPQSGTYEIVVKRMQFYGEDAARVLNALGQVTSAFEMTKMKFGTTVSESSGPRFDTADLYATGAKKHLTPEDVLMRIKEFYHATAKA